MKKRILQISLGLLVLLIIGAVVVLLSLNSIVKRGVETVGPMVTKVPVKLEAANISVFGGRGELKGFVVGNPEGYKTPEAIKVGTVTLAVAPGSLLSDKKHVKLIKVEGPEITYETDLKGSNLGKLLENVRGTSQSEPKGGTSETAPTKLQVDEFVITGGKVRVAATMLGSATVPLPDIRLTRLGEGPDGITPADLAERVLGEVLNAVTKAVAEHAGKLPDAGKALGTTASDQLKKAGGAVSDLLKKK